MVGVSNRLAIFTIAAALVGCGSESDEFASRVTALVEDVQEEGGSFAFGEATDFDWDRVWFIEGYSSRPAIERDVGAASDDIPDEAPERGLIVFARGGDVIAAYEFPVLPDGVDPLCLTDYSPVSNEDDKFVLRQGAGGSDKYLVANAFWRSDRSRRSACRLPAINPKRG